MFSAFVYILKCSARNRILAQLRRLKQPKYTIALSVGLLYFFFVFGGNVIWSHHSPQRSSPPPALAQEWFEWGAIILSLLYLVFIWVFKAAGPGLLFKPAEQHYLFTAPLTRRQVIHYYFLRAQLGLLLTTLILSIFVSIRTPSGALYAMIGWFVVSNIVFLHQTAASLVRASVFQHGKAGLKRMPDKR